MRALPPAQQLRQLGDVGGDALRLVAGEELGRPSVGPAPPRVIRTRLRGRLRSAARRLVALPGGALRRPLLAREDRRPRRPALLDESTVSALRADQNMRQRCAGGADVSAVRAHDTGEHVRSYRRSHLGGKGSALLQQLRQLGDVGGDAPGLVVGQQRTNSTRDTRNAP